MRASLALLGIAVAILITPPIASGSADDPILDKISSSLFSAGISVRGGHLDHGIGGTLDILIHVEEPSPGAFADRLEALGVSVKHRFTYLDVYSAECAPSLLDVLSSKGWVRYIEWDAPGLLDLEVSTGAVKAPKVWSSMIDEGTYTRPGPTGIGSTIAVVDSGIDAGHPDLDYGEKTLINVKAAQAGAPWVEMENTDTSVGHGSHCAGIAAGNGDGSAGGRAGVAPGANLVGLSLSEGTEEVSTSNYLYGLEWVFEHSRQGGAYTDPPIRVCTNSWHTTVGEYDPDMALSIMINRLSYENNVVCTFSAGNDGRNDPEGTTIWTSQQGATPAAIMVAAHERDGSAAAEFTSHGQVGLVHTYPDVGAPGVRIWAAHARRTGISAGSVAGGNPNPYYLAISGTSMSTPHIAGAVALLFEACPSLTMSTVPEDYSGDDPDWFHSHEFRFVHEAELVLEASATRIPYREGAESETRIYVNDNSTGWGERGIDYVQGYGFVDLEKAVGIALTLDRLRRSDPDRDVTVFDALHSFDDVVGTGLEGGTNRLTTSWEGEYSRFNDQNGKPLVVQNQTRYLFVPEGTGSLDIELQYTPFSVRDLYAGGISVEVDYDLDGEPDHGGDSPLFSRPGTYEIPLRGTGVFYGITVRGQGIRLLRPLRDTSYMELRIPYVMRAILEVSGDNITAGPQVFSWSMNAPLSFERVAGPSDNIRLDVTHYDMSKARGPWEDGGDAGGSGSRSLWVWAVVIALAMITVILVLYLRRRR